MQGCQSMVGGSIMGARVGVQDVQLAAQVVPILAGGVVGVQPESRGERGTVVVWGGVGYLLKRGGFREFSLWRRGALCETLVTTGECTACGIFSEHYHHNN